MTLSELARLKNSIRVGTVEAQITLFPSAMAVRPEGHLTLEEFIGAVRDGRWHDAVQDVRNAFAKGDSTKAQDLKRRLSAVTISSKMETRAKDAPTRILGHSGWMQADFDGKDNPALVQDEIRLALAQDPHVGAVFVGPSGTGIKAIVRIDSDRHPESFAAAEAYFLDRFGLKIDRACKDRERLCFVSYDPDAWLRPGESKPLPIPDTLPVAKKKESAPAASDLPHEEIDFDDVRAALACIPKRPEYSDWMRISSAVFAALPMEAGIQALNEWSPEEAAGEYHKKWLHRLKEITPGTLIWYAQQHGFDPKQYFRRKRWMGTILFPGKNAQRKENPWGEPKPVADHPHLDPDDDREARIREELKNGQRGDSRLFRAERGQDYSFDPAARVWRRYDETTGCWEKDYSRQTILEISNVCLEAYGALTQSIAQDMRDRPPATKNDIRMAEIDTLMARQRQLNAASYIKQVAELASMEPGGSRSAPEYDRGRGLLACANGVFDFSQMVLRSATRSDLITMASPAEYVDEAKCPQFDAFLARAFGDDSNLIDYWWRIVGYSLTGYVDHDALFFCYGSGANGKSTSFLVLRMLLGDGLSSVVNVQTVLGGGFDSAADYRKAALEGKRLVITDELPAGKQLNESMVKALLGGEDIQARRPYEQPYCFSPTHKIWMVGNHKPRISGTDHGIWRRIHLIPWTNTIPAEERRPRHELLAIFRAELSGILFRAIGGYDDFLSRGGRLDPPQAVMEATEEYRQEEDSLGRFLTERITPVEGARILVKDLFADYRNWCEATGEKATIETANKMSMALRKMDGMEVRPAGKNQMTLFNRAWHEG